MLATFPLSTFVAQRFIQHAQRFIQHSVAKAYVPHSLAKQWETQRVREAYNVRKACEKACNSAINWRSLSIIAYLGNY